MAASAGLADYYAVLQVHPDADDEVIAAAYRQLIKKYHPDVAGDDPLRVADHSARARAINEAFGVLRDRERRRQYDSARIFFGSYQPRYTPPSAPPRTASSPSGQAAAPHGPSAESPHSPPPPSSAEREAPQAPEYAAAQVTLETTPPSPFAAVSALYYLLPGTYEWEQGKTRELITVVLLPVVITLAFVLATGRLDAWIGTTLVAKLAGAVVILLLSLPLLSSLPRVALAAGPTFLLLTGLATPALQAAHVPVWLALLLAAVVSLAFSARLYVFSVLPALAACYALNVATHSM